MRRNGNAISVILIAFLLVVLFNIDKITDYTAKLISPMPAVVVPPSNDYAKKDDFIYVQKTTTFMPYSKQDLINIFYSVLNNGYESFTFYCSSEYTTCLDDVSDIADDDSTLMTDIGNFVHPYNNFTNIDVILDSLGEVNIKITKMYNEEQINAINTKIENVMKELFTDDMDIHDKILVAHDYVIDNANYDLDDTKDSGNAYGTLINGESKCAGYADSMAIILSKLGIKNYKVASSQHVWNAVYIDNEWLQIDLTWDDPIVENGTNITDTIRHKFYMIDTPTLHSYDTKEHTFDQSIYVELKA